MTLKRFLQRRWPARKALNPFYFNVAVARRRHNKSFPSYFKKLVGKSRLILKAFPSLSWVAA